MEQPSSRGLLLQMRGEPFVLAPFSHLDYRPGMPRDGTLTLSDVRGPTLTIVCEPCVSAAILVREIGCNKINRLELAMIFENIRLI